MITCAAIQFLINSTGRVATLCGHRHGDIYSTVEDLGLKWGKDISEVCQGFINTNGDFLDRYTAFQEALKCGQLSATTRQTKRENKEVELYSEDLY